MKVIRELGLFGFIKSRDTVTSLVKDGVHETSRKVSWFIVLLSSGLF